MRALPALMICLSLLLAPSVEADTAEDAENYERLRERLDTLFIDEGESAGQSIPAHIRSDADGYIRWADATIDLGWYIGVLATELHMRTRPERYPGFVVARDVDGIGEQLYLALNALERLDRVAEPSFDCGASESVNGFFIRDDVAAGFHERFGLSETRSDFLDGVVTNKEMSQDQVWHLMLGLALTAKLVDVRVRDRDLAAWAREQAQRIIEHVASNNWQITNPACDDRPVARGSAAIGNRPGAAHMIAFITEGALTYEVGASQQRLFDSLQDPDNAVYINPDNQHMVMTIAAIGEGFGSMTIDALVELAETHQWWAYPLLYAALRDDSEAPRWCVYRERVASESGTLLSELGDAEPSSPRPARATHSFTSSNRFIRGTEQAYVGAEGSEGHRFHGLDFLLLHNLRAIAAPNTWEGTNAPMPERCAPPVPALDAAMDLDSAVDSDAGVDMDGGMPDAGTEMSSSGCSTSRGSSFAWLLVIAGLLRRRPFFFGSA